MKTCLLLAFLAAALGTVLWILWAHRCSRVHFLILSVLSGRDDLTLDELRQELKDMVAGWELHLLGHHLDELEDEGRVTARWIDVVPGGAVQARVYRMVPRIGSAAQGGSR